MNLRALLAAIRRYWRTFLGVTVPLLALGGIGLYFIPLQDVSTTELLVSIQGSTTAAAYQNDGVVAGRIGSYIPLLTSDVVAQRVVDKLGLPLTASELAAKISAVNVPPSTALIDVAVADESPDRARQLADTVASEFISYTGALETPTGEDGQKVTTTVVTAASEAKARIGELVVLGVAVALVALALGAWAVRMRARRDPVWLAEHEASAANEPVSGAELPSAAQAIPEEPEMYRDPLPVGAQAWGEEPETHEDPVAVGAHEAAQEPFSRPAPVGAQPWEEEPETHDASVAVGAHDAAEEPISRPAAVGAQAWGEEPETYEAPGAHEAAQEPYSRPAPVGAQAWGVEPETHEDPVAVGAHAQAVEPEIAYSPPVDAAADTAVDEHRRPPTRLRSRPAPTGGRELRLMSAMGGGEGNADAPASTPPAEPEATAPEIDQDAARVNGSRHRAEDVDTEAVRTDEEARRPMIRVNGSRHRAQDADADTPSDESARAVVKDWDGQRWIRRR
jgi:capsular polysaccharide biosynthesis protein